MKLTYFVRDKLVYSRYALLGIVPLLFLIIGVATLSHYGWNWDEPYHFHRGQAYLHFLLTGKTNFSDLPSYPNLTPECQGPPEVCDGGPEGPTDVMKFSGTYITYEDAVSRNFAKDVARRRSLFQANVYNLDYFMGNDVGHPPASDILAAFTNFIFYQKLWILEDIEAHHLFEVISMSLLILSVALFTYKSFGVLASLIASFSLATYPLVFAESHFNIKDPPEAAFFGLTIISFYFGIVKQNWYLIFLSAIFSGLALGTKFNALFLPFIIVPWLIAYVLTMKKKPEFLKKLSIPLVIYPFIVLLIFYAFWPYLWQDPVINLLKVIAFYQEIGTSVLPEVSNYISGGFNIFPFFWIVVTTPLFVLFLAIIGLFTSVMKFVRQKKTVFLLPILWFLVPILRVSLPNTAIHGGIRQVMEFVPAMSILAGVGGDTFYQYATRKRMKFVFFVAMGFAFGFVIWEVARLHPNENVYFNQLVGGLPGAAQKSVPYWGTTYGNVYLQGVEWLNGNAEPGSKLSLLIGTMANVPWVKLRSDIQYHNRYWSGPNRGGEYAMEMVHNYSQKEMYRFMYYETFLNPVYEVKIDGVTLLKIWKNDLAHTKPGFEKETEYKPTRVKVDGGKMELALGETVDLTRLIIKHGGSDCQKQVGGYILTSIDGRVWQREPDLIERPQSPPEASEETIGSDDYTFVYLFPARRTRFLVVDTTMENSCYLENPRLSVYGLDLSDRTR